MKNFTLVPLAALCLVVAGCASSTRESDWRCQPQQGLGCVTAAQADGLDPLPQTDMAHPADNQAKLDAFMNKGTGGGLDGVLKSLFGGSDQPPPVPMVAVPHRTAEVVARVWLAPWVDGSGNLVEPTYLQTVVVPAHWEN